MKPTLTAFLEELGEAIDAQEASLALSLLIGVVVRDLAGPEGFATAFTAFVCGAAYGRIRGCTRRRN